MGLTSLQVFTTRGAEDLATGFGFSTADNELYGGGSLLDEIKSPLISTISKAKTNAESKSTPFEDQKRILSSLK